MKDKDIIELFFASSEQAIPVLQDTYGHLCMKIIYQILNDFEDTNECVNDVWLAVWNKIPPERPDSLKAYVCRIARNLALKKLDYNTADKRRGETVSLMEELETCVPDSGSEYEQVELVEIINQFLGQLDKESRVIFLKRYWYAEPLESIAKEFGYSKNHVSVKLTRIRKRLKRYLENEGIFI